MLRPAAWIIEKLRLGPMHKVIGRAGHDVAHAAPRCTMILAVLADARIPKSEILRVECSARNHGFIGNRRPVNSVRRTQRQQAALYPRHSFVPSFRLGCGIRIEKRRKAVRPATIPHDVISLRAFKFE